MAVLTVIEKILLVLSFTDYLILIVLALSAYVFRFYYKYITRPNKLPGPLPLPFIECSYVFTSDTRKLFTSLQQKYGDICEIYLYGIRRIVISRPEYLEKMLTPSSKDTTFMIRLPYTEAIEEFGMARRGITANHDVKLWRFNRHFFNQAVLAPSFNYEVVEWANKLFPELEGYWKSLVNSDSYDDNLQNNWTLEIDLATWIRRFTNDMIVVLLTGERSYSMASYYNSQSPVKVLRSNPLIQDSERFIKGAGDHLMGLTLFMYLGSFFRHHVPFYKYRVKKLLENRDYLFEILNSIIKKRRKEIEETPVDAKLRHDMLTSLITANTERDINNIQSVKGDMLRPLTDVEIRGNLFDAFLGGTDTVSTSFSIISYYLCHYPQVKQKMVAEIDSIFPPNAPFDMKYNDLLKLEYCEAVMNEVSRIRPTANEFPRYVENPCEVAGYQWDAGVMFHVNINGIHSHKDHWPNPEIFDPERFYKKDPNARHKFSLVTFGGGLRNCPGRKLATIELLSLIVLIFRKFDIELVDINAPLMTKSSIVNSCEKLKVKIRPRN
ncbi:13119_t:CDS:2 [Cetraspora pellucida]|uniref:13119_t:CDS:1 n=1 Tax=Cetraspora pellucida TaxID=1433469 RepID=A0A9N9EEI0_9GLOM|nr:13119_t:CDS:2 [Cetraspora pellucida]